MNILRNFLREQEGQDGVEYALLIGFVSSALVVGSAPFITGFNAFWGDAGTAVTGAGTAIPKTTP